MRRERTAAGARDFDVVRRHRSRGPLLVLLGILGYVAGALLIYLDKGHIFKYPIHNIVGSGIVILLTATFFIAREIKGPESPWRTLHGIVGIGILCLYLVQLVSRPQYSPCNRKSSLTYPAAFITVNSRKNVFLSISFIIHFNN